jgi:hypothetical protein
MKFWELVKKIGKQLWSLVTDPKWDLDAKKVAGLFCVCLGGTILVTCTVKWDFGAPATYGSAILAMGLGLLGWSGHTTDKTDGS